LHDPDGALVSRPSRKRRSPALLRGRFRTLFFAVLAVAAPALGHGFGALPAVVGVLLGLWSIQAARARGDHLAYSFAVADWLLLGCVLAFSGGAESWLLAAVPVLALGQLASAPRREWPFLLAPALLLLVVLAIADPSLGGSRAGGVAKVAVLAVGGWIAATRLHRAPARTRRPARVDASTGLYTAERLDDELRVRSAEALAEHRPLSVVVLRIDHYRDSRDFLGPERSEELVRGVARRIGRGLTADDTAFRVRADAFLLTLPGRSLGEAQALAAEIGRDVSANLIGGRRQTLSAGAASFPTVRSLRDLVAAALEEACRVAPVVEPAPSVVHLAAAR
jgi:diguanylate cyclase (GGDEF)-like protein